MKKVTYLMILMFSLVLMTTSCCKDDDDIPNVITTNDLVGDWNFQSLTFNGTVYDTEAELFELDKTYNYIQLSFLDVTTTIIGLRDLRGATSTYEQNYVLSNNTINFDNGFLVFHIDNWETFDGTFLELKLTSSIYPSVTPIDGVYIMTR